MFEDRAMALPQNISEVLGRGASGGVMLAHIAEPSGIFGDPLSVARFAFPFDRQMGRLEELGPGDQGDARGTDYLHEVPGRVKVEVKRKV